MTLTQPSFISFIVPVYNVPTEMLCECLHSLFSLALQTHEVQIIVVDDGCDYDITQGWHPAWIERVTLIRQANQGLSMARNNALAVATGQYVQFVDADDYLFSSLYNEVLAYLKAQAIDLLYFDTTATTTPQSWTTPKGVTSGADFMLHNNLRSSACGYAFKRELVGDLRFVAGTYYEDIEFTTRIVLKAKSMAATTAQPYYYRVRKGSITSKKTVEDYEQKFLPMSAQILTRLQHLLVEAAQRPALERRIAQLTMDHVYNTMRYTHHYAYLSQTLTALRRQGLYPFPNKHYTRKYTLFRSLVACPITRHLLTLLLH